jgi:hypothetical protein
MGHQDPILGTRHFTFGAIGHDHGLAAAAVGQCTPLAPDRETRAASAEEAARVEVGDEIAPVGRAWQAAEPLDVCAEALRPAVERRTAQESAD